MPSYLLFLLLGLCAGQATAFFFNRRVDCQLSEWTEWSEPYAFGTVKREKKILRYPLEGGTACPTDLTETRETGRIPPVERTSEMFLKFFLSMNKRQSREFAATPTGPLRDLLIIVDASGSIGRSKFDVAKNDLAKLMGYLCPVGDPFKDGQRAALIRFNNKVDEIFDFNTYKDTAGVKAGILKMQYTGGLTCTGDAFEYARTTMFTTAKGMRTSSNVKQEVLLISDGQSNCGYPAVEAAKRLSGIADVFALFVNSVSDAGQKELHSYVSTPVETHLFAVSDYQNLTELVAYIGKHINKITCAPFDLEK